MYKYNKRILSHAHTHTHVRNCAIQIIIECIMHTVVWVNSNVIMAIVSASVV